ncbi:MAG: nuclear transport factor 2 family protein [Acidobacteria bacterium]|nr:nuclear transport factor 2 family protein [Acidobacteriota bacterium]
MVRPVCIGVVCALLVVGSAGGASAQGKAEQELIQVEKDWCTAMQKKDASFLERMLATDYVGISMRGMTNTKADATKGIKDPATRLDVCVDTDFNVRVYGDVGVVIARYTRAGVDAGGPYKDRTGWYTDVFVRRNGQWQCVASQSTTTVAASR